MCTRGGGTSHANFRWGGGGGFTEKDRSLIGVFKNKEVISFSKYFHPSNCQSFSWMRDVSEKLYPQTSIKILGTPPPKPYENWRFPRLNFKIFSRVWQKPAIELGSSSKMSLFQSKEALFFGTQGAVKLKIGYNDTIAGPQTPVILKNNHIFSWKFALFWKIRDFIEWKHKVISKFIKWHIFRQMLLLKWHCLRAFVL